jgi:hypothetical protein
MRDSATSAHTSATATTTWSRTRSGSRRRSRQATTAEAAHAASSTTPGTCDPRSAHTWSTSWSASSAGTSR